MSWENEITMAKVQATVILFTHKDKYYSLSLQRANPEPSKQKQTELEY